MFRIQTQSEIAEAESKLFYEAILDDIQTQICRVFQQQTSSLDRLVLSLSESAENLQGRCQKLQELEELRKQLEYKSLDLFKQYFRRQIPDVRTCDSIEEILAKALARECPGQSEMVSHESSQERLKQEKVLLVKMLEDLRRANEMEKEQSEERLKELFNDAVEKLDTLRNELHDHRTCEEVTNALTLEGEKKSLREIHDVCKKNLKSLKRKTRRAVASKKKKLELIQKKKEMLQESMGIHSDERKTMREYIDESELNSDDSSADEIDLSKYQNIREQPVVAVEEEILDYAETEPELDLRLSSESELEECDFVFPSPISSQN